jgi:hypothetical protein
VRARLSQGFARRRISFAKHYPIRARSHVVSGRDVSRPRIVTLFAAKIDNRRVRLYRLRHGLMLFTVGVALKCLVANTVSLPADAIFKLPGEQSPEQQQALWLHS